MLAALEAASLLLIALECRHFRVYGYTFHAAGWLAAFALGSAVAAALWRRAIHPALSVALGASMASELIAIRDFPLNYLRSDMLPVIEWADQRLLRGLNPYATMHVGTRVYDFPYLPGMLVAFLPAMALRIDPRWMNWICLCATALLVFLTAGERHKSAVSVLLGFFLLCPFLQYRHDLYLEPHWLLCCVAVVLLQRGRPCWSALVWGMSCAVYQLSWVVVPFFLLHSFRRGRWPGLGRVIALVLLGSVIVAGPFLPFAAATVAHNTVGQWSSLPHALADPINLSWWLTYLIRPDQLKWVQAAVLGVLFGCAILWGRCATVADMLRFMVAALALFIPLNVLVDGYFYLTLLLFALFFVCAESGWWREPAVRPARA